MAVFVGVGVKPRTEARWPSWKIQTMAPSVAPSVSALPSSARMGWMTLPVKRNSKMNVVITISPPATSRRALIACFASTSVAVAPPT